MPLRISDHLKQVLLMTKLLTLFAAALILAFISEQNTKAAHAAGRHYSVWGDWAYILLVTVLVLFSGLRTNYNDTWNYMSAFKSASGLSETLKKMGNFNLFTNPLFSLFQALIRSFTDDAQILVFISALITQICFVRFFKRYSENFLFSIFIYFTLGTFVFSLAAIKQVLAMAILTLAFPYLEQGKWKQYFIIVFVAMLFHTYALAFAVLPLFKTRPWGLFTFIFIAATAFVMMNFESAITAFMEQANDLGKTLAEFEVFGDATINLFRLGVYAVPPLISFLFQKWVFADSTRTDHVLVHMSIISFAFMCMGTQAGANMFGRMGNYFELATICCLPKMLYKTFSKASYHLVGTIACVCFMGFFIYANAVKISFDLEYQSISLWQFLSSLFF